ncbi:hypothetical protein PHYBOEH_003381 [Phytophthora boehmeriae]|uniref:Uncharacterized protein n=1 Tax=Phytophthora boehmeriae TaxID=109152 RepID=A0A8T1WNR5_9STRA|nr:hypothetical protein PHYBOEH_003381 [Phytophthora boehmeriae]
MKHSRRTHASRHRSSLLVLTLLLIVGTRAVVVAQTPAPGSTDEGAATVVPADTAATTGPPAVTDAPPTDEAPATVEPAGSETTDAPAAPTAAPPVATEAPPVATEAPTTAPVGTPPPASIDAAETEAPTPTLVIYVPTPAPVATEVPATTPPVTGSVPPTAAPPAATEAPAPVTEAPTAAPPATEAPTAAPPATEAPTAAPPATEAPTEAPAVTDAPTAAPPATGAPAEPVTPVPASTDPPTTAPPVTSAPAPVTPAPEAQTTAPAATPVPVTEAPGTTSPTLTPTGSPAPPTSAPPTSAPPTSAPPQTTAPTPAPATTTAPPAAAITASPAPVTPRPETPSPGETSKGSSTSSSGSSSIPTTVPSVSGPSEDNGEGKSTSESAGTIGQLTLSPINSDDHGGTTDNGNDNGNDNETGENNESGGSSESNNSSTASGHSSSFGGWKIAVVIAGAVCVVSASIFFAHMHHVRAVAAAKRTRGSSQQRALDSFFRRNRVTVGRETGGNDGNFVPDPLTPRDEIAVTMPSNNAPERPRTRTVDVIAGSAAQAFNRSVLAAGSSSTISSVDTPTESYRSGDDYDSFTGRQHAPSTTSAASSNFYRSNSVYSDASSASLGSIAPSAASSQRSAQVPLFPTRLETVASSQASSVEGRQTGLSTDRSTERSDRSSSDFSVYNSSMESTDGDFYRISNSVIDVSVLPTTMSERSESFSESLDSYPSESGRHNSTASAFSNDSFIARSTNGTDLSSNRDSELYRLSKDSELSEGEI